MHPHRAGKRETVPVAASWNESPSAFPTLFRRRLSGPDWTNCQTATAGGPVGPAAVENLADGLLRPPVPGRWPRTDRRWLPPIAAAGSCLADRATGGCNHSRRLHSKGLPRTRIVLIWCSRQNPSFQTMTRSGDSSDWLAAGGMYGNCRAGRRRIMVGRSGIRFQRG